MDINIQSVNFDADQKLLDYIRKKISKLDHYFDHITDIEIYLKLDGESAQIKDKLVEIKVNLPKQTLFCKETDKTFEAAFDAAYDNIKRQVRKYKEKLKGL